MNRSRPSGEAVVGFVSDSGDMLKLQVKSQILG
jgi:hypothetical protein